MQSAIEIAYSDNARLGIGMPLVLPKFGRLEIKIHRPVKRQIPLRDIACVLDRVVADLHGIIVSTQYQVVKAWFTLKAAPARMRTHLGAPMIPPQDILDLFHFRHACKSFDPERKISAADFDLILEAGRLSPASFGYEPWRFLVVQDSALRERLKAVTWGAQTHLPTASHFLVILSRRAADMRYDSPWLDTLMRQGMGYDDARVAARVARYRSFQEQDFHLLDDERASFDWSVRQCYIALANMMTVAAMRGIDSCAVEGYSQAAAEAVLNEAGLTEEGRFGVAVMCAFGYRVKPQTPKLRQPMGDIVRWA